MQKLLAELKRRQMFRVAAAYAVVAWLLLQIVNNVAPVLDLPPWVARAFLLLLVVGFPIALLFVWMHELSTPTSADDPASKAKITRLDFTLIGAVALVVGIFLYQQAAPTSGGQTAAVQQAGVAPASAPGSISIAVLPFANMSGDAGQEFFSDGITEEINGALAKVPNLQVVARTSAFQFKGQNRDIQAIGQQLHASHLIEGSVRKAGDQLRITAQLVRADNGLQLWSETYDRQLTNIFAIQEDIAQAIAGALKVPLGLQQGETLVRNRTEDLESYQQYLHARALVRARGISVSQAIAILESVVERDPSFAPAWPLLAEAYAILPTYQGPVYYSGSTEDARRATQAVFEKGEQAAREAIRLDPEQPVSYAAMGFIQFNLGQWIAADDFFKQAQALDPNDPDVLHLHSLALNAEGRLKDALTMRQQLQTLEPFVPVYNIVTAQVMQLNGQNEATIAMMEPIPPEAAGGFSRNLRLATAYAAAGRYGAAADTLLLITSNGVSRRSVEDAARLLRRAPEKAAEPLPNLEDELAFVYAYVGAPNRVLDNVERSFEIGYLNANVYRSLWGPLHAPVRKTDRFKGLVRKIGLVDYWRERGWPDLCRPQGIDDFTCD